MNRKKRYNWLLFQHILSPLVYQILSQRQIYTILANIFCFTYIRESFHTTPFYFSHHTLQPFENILYLIYERPLWPSSSNVGSLYYLFHHSPSIYSPHVPKLLQHVFLYFRQYVHFQTTSFMDNSTAHSVKLVYLHNESLGYLNCLKHNYSWTERRPSDHLIWRANSAGTWRGQALHLGLN